MKMDRRQAVIASKDDRAFFLPQPIISVNEKNLVDKIRFEQSYIRLKSKVEKDNRGRVKIKLMLLVFWVLAGCFVGFVSGGGWWEFFVLVGCSTATALTVDWVWVKTRDYHTLISALIEAGKPKLEATFIDFVESKAGVKKGAANDDITSSKPERFDLYSGTYNPDLNDNEILMLGTYIFGSQTVLVSVKLAFNKNYSILRVSDYLMIPVKERAA